MINEIIRVIYLDGIMKEQQAEIDRITEMFEQNPTLLPEKNENGIYIEIYNGVQVDGTTIIRIPPLK